ncbi:hypothetical protein TrCOL_g4744, partial [Triparma columacea]
VLAVVDSFTKKGVTDHIDNWINWGWLSTIFIDEPQEFASQYLLREEAFRKFSTWATGPYGKLIFWVLMSGSLTPVVKSFVVGMLGYDDDALEDKFVRIGLPETEEEDGFIPNPNIKFVKEGGEDIDKDLCINTVVHSAKANAADGVQHLILTVGKDDGELVARRLMEGPGALTEEQVLFIHSGVDRGGEVGRRLREFQLGRGKTLILISTQPVAGLDAKYLLVVDVLGCWNIICLYQSLTRVARGWGQWGIATCWLWKGMERELENRQGRRGGEDGNPFMAQGLPAVLVDQPPLLPVSYLQIWKGKEERATVEDLFQEDCMRGHLTMGRGMGGRTTCANMSERMIGGVEEGRKEELKFQPCSSCDSEGLFWNGVLKETMEEEMEEEMEEDMEEEEEVSEEEDMDVSEDLEEMDGEDGNGSHIIIQDNYGNGEDWGLGEDGDGEGGTYGYVDVYGDGGSEDEDEEEEEEEDQRMDDDGDGDGNMGGMKTSSHPAPAFSPNRMPPNKKRGEVGGGAIGDMGGGSSSSYEMREPPLYHSPNRRGVGGEAIGDMGGGSSSSYEMREPPLYHSPNHVPDSGTSSSSVPGGRPYYVRGVNQVWVNPYASTTPGFGGVGPQPDPPPDVHRTTSGSNMISNMSRSNPTGAAIRGSSSMNRNSSSRNLISSSGSRNPTGAAFRGTSTSSTSSTSSSSSRNLISSSGSRNPTGAAFRGTSTSSRSSRNLISSSGSRNPTGAAFRGTSTSSSSSRNLISSSGSRNPTGAAFRGTSTSSSSSRNLISSSGSRNPTGAAFRGTSTSTSSRSSRNLISSSGSRNPTGAAIGGTSTSSSSRSSRNLISSRGSRNPTGAAFRGTSTSSTSSTSSSSGRASQAFAQSVLSPPAAQGAMGGGGNANVLRYFTDGQGSDWVCGDAGVRNDIGCGLSNYNSAFPCRHCKKLKPGYRKQGNRLYQHNSFTCGCKSPGPGGAHFNNWGNKDNGQVEPFCKMCNVKVGAFHIECGYNRGYLPDGTLYWGIHDGEERIAGDNFPLERKGDGVLRGDM